MSNKSKDFLIERAVIINGEKVLSYFAQKKIIVPGYHYN